MPNAANIEQVKMLEETLANAKNVVLVDQAGVSVGEQTDLRVKLAEAGGSYMVAKNTLIKIALTNTYGELPSQFVDALNGPTSILFGLEDAVGATKALVDFAKDHENLDIKAGLMTDIEAKKVDYLSEDAVKALAKLPSKDQLRATVVGTLQAPIAGLVNVLAGNIRGLVTVLGAIKDQKSE